MERPKILPLPGNSIVETNFYDGPALAQMPGVEWPDNASIGVDQGSKPEPTDPEPMPFRIIDTNGGR